MSNEKRQVPQKHENLASGTPTNGNNPTYFVLHPSSQIRFKVTKEEPKMKQGKRPTNCKRTQTRSRKLSVGSSSKAGKMEHPKELNENIKNENNEDEENELQELAARLNKTNNGNKKFSTNEVKIDSTNENLNNNDTRAPGSSEPRPQVPEASSNPGPQWFGGNMQHVILPSVKRVSFFRDAFFTTPRITHDYRPERKPSNKSEQGDSRGRASTRSPKISAKERARKQDFIRKNIKKVAEIASGRKISPSRSPQGRQVSPMPKRIIKPQAYNQLKDQTLSKTKAKTATSVEVDFEQECIQQLDEVTDSEMTSTFEVESESSTERYGRVDCDQSMLNFRMEWTKRMATIEKRSNSIKRTLEKIPKKGEREKSMLEKLCEITDSLISVKHDMTELYDYFDHFDHEEETLLQQMQRQLASHKKENKILEYKLSREQIRDADSERVGHLEEELKLSRQVAVSLHWELQRNDEKQNRLEDENKELRHQLVASECSEKILSNQVAALQNSVDQMSLHAPSRVLPTTTISDDSSKNSESEMKRQIQFMKEKEDMMVKRLVDVQTEKDTIKDELIQYRAQFGELAASPSAGSGRHTDLKLRLKLAEDHAGLLARKVVELEMEIESLRKQSTPQNQSKSDELRRNNSASDLQFLEDEVGALRHALEEMEKENNKLTTEIIAIKSRRIRSSSSNTLSSPIHGGGGIVISLSSDNIYRDNFPLKEAIKSVSDKVVSPLQDSIHSTVSSTSEPVGNYVRLRPMTYYRLPAGKISTPSSPVNGTVNLTLDGAWERYQSGFQTEEVAKSPYSSVNGTGSLVHSDTIWNLRPLVSTVDTGVDATTPEELELMDRQANEYEDCISDDVENSVISQNNSKFGGSCCVSNSTEDKHQYENSNRRQISISVDGQITDEKQYVSRVSTSEISGNVQCSPTHCKDTSKLKLELHDNHNDVMKQARDESSPGVIKKMYKTLTPTFSRLASPCVRGNRDLLERKTKRKSVFLKVLDAVVICIVLFLLLSSLSVDVTFKISFLVGLFFII